MKAITCKSGQVLHAFLAAIGHVNVGFIHQQETGLVLIATGGFAGDTSPASLMAKWAPQLLQKPTTSSWPVFRMLSHMLSIYWKSMRPAVPT